MGKHGAEAAEAVTPAIQVEVNPMPEINEAW